MTNKNPVKKFKPGQCGNPNGRPKKGQTLTDLIMQRMDKKKFVESVLNQLYKGDPQMLKYVMDRVDGKIPDKHELVTDSEMKINIKLTDD